MLATNEYHLVATSNLRSLWHSSASRRNAVPNVRQAMDRYNDPNQARIGRSATSGGNQKGRQRR
jgi:hypothetical protein